MALGQRGPRLFLAPHRLVHQHHAEGPGSIVVQLESSLGVGIGRMIQVQDALQVRDDITKDFEAFGTELKAEIGHPRQVPTGRGEATDQSCP
jgi:hypothetical protein